MSKKLNLFLFGGDGVSDFFWLEISLPFSFCFMVRDSFFRQNHILLVVQFSGALSEPSLLRCFSPNDPLNSSSRPTVVVLSVNIAPQHTDTPAFKNPPSSSHNHGSEKWVPPIVDTFRYLSTGAIFHFHDYGRKNKSILVTFFLKQPNVIT